MRTLPTGRPRAVPYFDARRPCLTKTKNENIIPSNSGHSPVADFKWEPWPVSSGPHLKSERLAGFVVSALESGHHLELELIGQ
jgi:hypothetical protein